MCLFKYACLCTRHWPMVSECRGGLNIGASGGEDRCAACRGGGHGLMSGIHPVEK